MLTRHTTNGQNNRPESFGREGTINEIYVIIYINFIFLNEIFNEINALDNSFGTKIAPDK